MTILTPDLPRETDEKIAELEREHDKFFSRKLDVEEAAHRTAGDKRKDAGWGRRGPWLMSLEDALAKAPAENSARNALLLKMAEIQAQIDPLEAIWREHRWQRFFPCFPNGILGHIHATQSCHTLNRGRYASNVQWWPDLSGKTIDDAIAVPKLGPVLCQHCFLDAKAEHKRDPAEVNRERNAVKKAAERAAREAAQAPKKLDPENEAFRTRHNDDRIETVAACKALIGAAVEAAVELEYWESGLGEERYIAEAARYRYDPDPGWAPRQTRRARRELEEKEADAGEATRVLLAREQAHEGWGLTPGALAKLASNAEKRARKDRRATRSDEGEEASNGG